MAEAIRRRQTDSFDTPCFISRTAEPEANPVAKAAENLLVKRSFIH
jgi:hypothetical protein